MNICTIVGRLGKDPDIVSFPDSGNYEAKLSVSTKRSSRENVTDWHTVVVKVTDTIKNIIQPYAKSGMLVSISGELVYDNFTGTEGQNIRLPKILVRHSSGFQLLNSKSANSENEGRKNGDDQSDNV